MVSPDSPSHTIIEPVATATMTTGPISDVSSPDSRPSCPDANPKTSALPRPSSVRQEQGDLPDVTSLEMIIADPVTACQGCPIQEIMGGGQRESGAPQDRQVEDPAVAPSGDGDAAADDAKRAAPAPRYRPAYELADAAHERLGRGTQPPVLNA
jgi:hypothetical protein